jgi:putative ABC transport system substrate-binding protein
MRLARLTVLATLALALLAAPLAAEGQPPGKTWRIGLLDYANADAARVAWWNALRQRLRELGYVEGQSVVFESRWGNGDLGQLQALAADLINARVDIIVTGGSEAALAAKQATSSIPIVMATGADPVALGLVASLGRPGGNVTGVTSIQSELATKRLELLKQVIPTASRVAILWDTDNRASALSVRDAEAGAPSLGISLQSVSVRNPHEFQAAFSTMKRDRAGAAILVASPAFFGHRRRLADLAVAQRLPMMVGSREYAEAGGLLSYGTDYPDLFRRAAAYVNKILNGAMPGDLPVEQPTKFELVMNLKTAKALGLTIPPSVLARADEVIQ